MNSELFLKYFNLLQDTMAKQLQQDGSASFRSLIELGKSHKNKIITTYYDELDLYRELRNILVHENVPFKDDIATPTDATVERIKMISEKMLHPKTVEEVFAGPVTCFKKDDLLLKLLKEISNYQYMQFPVFDNDKLIGIISENSLGNFLAKCIDVDRISLKNLTVGDVLSIDEAHDNYLIVGVNKPLIEIVGVLRHEIDRGNSSFVLLVSQVKSNPKPEDIKAIITPFDMPKIIDNQ